MVSDDVSNLDKRNLVKRLIKFQTLVDIMRKIELEIVGRASHCVVHKWAYFCKQ